MNTNPHQDALRSRWTLEGTIPLSAVADGAQWHRARSVATGDPVTLFVVRGETALETADAVRRAYLVEDERLMPVRDVVVLDDPREDDADSGSGSGTDTDAGTHPTTVVEYPLPPAPPLAAMLGTGPLHPETARAVIGEAATGLEVARRRGLRHQFLDSNRVFVDPRSGVVQVLGVGVEAASHPGLDRSREVASFQDTAALTALLYRALTGRSPRPDENGVVPKPSTVVPEDSAQIPADLDLLCELVLNETSEEIPETTRGLIAALEPWQSIPVTVEAYQSRGEQAALSSRETPGEAETGGATGTGSAAEPEDLEPAGGAAGLAAAAAAAGATAAAGGAAAAAAPREGSAPSDGSSSGDVDEDGLESTALMAAVSAEGSEESLPDTDHSGEDDPDESEPPPEDTTAQEAQPADPAADLEATQPQNAPSSAAAQAIVRDLRLDQKRSTSAFPAPLDITTQQSPRHTGSEATPSSAALQTDHPAAQAAGDGRAASAAAGPAVFAGGAGGITVSGGGIAQAPGGAVPVGRPADPSNAPAAPWEAAAALPSRRAGTHWPLASTSGPADGDQLAPRPAEPIQPSPRPQDGSLADRGDGTPAATSAQTPAAAIHPGPGATSPTPVTVTGRSEPVAGAPATGPIVVQGREQPADDDQPEGSTQPSQRSTLLREVISVAVDSDNPEAYAMGASQPEQRSRQSQWILLGAVLVVIVALVFAISTITSGLRERVENPLNTEPPTSAPVTEEEAEEEATEEEPDEEEEELPPAELDGVDLLVEGSDSDPDNTDQMERITDGDPETFWSTQHYTSPQYGGLKEAIGVRIDLVEESTLSAVVVTTARNSGGTLELRAVDEDDSVGEVLASGEFAGDGEVRLELEEPLEAESVALWLSELPPDSNENGRFRGRIAEIQVE